VKRALSSAGSAIAAHDVLSARNVLLQSTHGTSVPVYQWLSSGRLGLKLSVASRSIGRAGQQSTPTKPVAYGVGNASAAASGFNFQSLLEPRYPVSGWCLVCRGAR